MLLTATTFTASKLLNPVKHFEEFSNGKVLQITRFIEAGRKMENKTKKQEVLLSTFKIVQYFCKKKEYLTKRPLLD